MRFIFQKFIFQLCIIKKKIIFKIILDTQNEQTKGNVTYFSSLQLYYLIVNKTWKNFSLNETKNILSFHKKIFPLFFY